jgi:3'(2'), 5'-bisphosphate nucleotidase
MIVDTRMQELRYNTKDSLLNPHFFVIGDADHDWPNYL